jgi:hypothetical protein
MEKCNCGKEFEKKSSLSSHARFCKSYVKEEKKIFTGKCECGKKFEKAQSLNAHYSHCLIHRKGKKTSDRGSGWKVSDESRKKGGKTYIENIKSGKIIPSFKGKMHTKESREKISDKMTEKNNGYIKTKYFEVFCNHSRKYVKLQGTWELEFSKVLDAHGIKWEKDRKHFFYYVFDGIRKKYFPDFYLPDRNIYVEIKGFWFKSKDGRIDDRRKMDLVIDQNREIVFIIIDSMEKIRNYT